MGGIILGQNTHRTTSQKRIRLKGGSALTMGGVLSRFVLSLYVFYMFLLTIMNPKIFKSVRFNSYITEYQRELLNRLSRERNCPKTELVREALHYFLRKNGLDDELIYDEEDDEKRMAEIFLYLKN